VEFARPGKEAAHAMAGNGWRAPKPKDLGLQRRIIELGRAIAAKLLEGTVSPGTPLGFVLFHFDGDHAWAQRERAKTEKIADLWAFVARSVIPPIDHALHERNRRGGAVDVEAGRKAALLRLRRLTPFYSIEAWLFQNTAQARRACAAACGRHLKLVAGWAADRGALDELDGDDQPKNQLPCVVTKDHIALATDGYPAEEVLAVRKSYATAVDNLRRCRDLRAALRRTVAS
jgi:hypothetical protein